MLKYTAIIVWLVLGYLGGVAAARDKQTAFTVLSVTLFGWVGFVMAVFLAPTKIPGYGLVTDFNRRLTPFVVLLYGVKRGK